MEALDSFAYVTTGPGTLAGRYLRMFWQPVYRAQDLPPGRAVPIRVMGEDLTLYRGEAAAGAPPLPNPSTDSGQAPSPPGGKGQAHLVAFRCAHRGTQLSVGWVEEDCIRCRYHGWMY